jgi:hypothetical protein
MTPTPSLFFTGGALDPTHPSYVRRSADDDAVDSAGSGQIIYTIAPRQMGKTSLLKRLATDLQERTPAWVCCFLDMTTYKHLDQAQWFGHVAEAVALACRADIRRTPIVNQQDFRAFLMNDAGLGRDASLHLALFFDEIEGLLELDFSDAFLMTLRSLHQDRSDYPGHLFMAFAGSADPKVLIKDPNISPFNVAEEIVLKDFIQSESDELTARLAELRAPMDDAVGARIYHWADGQPYLTQRICELIARRVRRGKIAEISLATVDQVVLSELLAPSSLDKNVRHVMNRVEKLERWPAQLWRRLVTGQDVYATEPGFNALYLTGAVRDLPDRRVCIRNCIYLEQVRLAPPPPPPIETLDFHRGLDSLRVLLSTEDDHREHALFMAQLLDNLRREQRFGATDALLSDRARILDGLNELARRLGEESFVDLCC